MRVVNYRMPEDEGDAAQALEDVTSNIPDFLRILRQQSGFLAGNWGVCTLTGNLVVVTYWRGQSDIESAAFVLRYLQQRAPWPSAPMISELALDLS